MIDLTLDVDIELEVSLRLIAGSVYEWCRAAGATESALRIIERGVFRDQVLQGVSLVYIGEGKRKVGELLFKFDWDKLTATVASDISSLAYELDPGRPITDQAMTQFTKMVEDFSAEALRESGAESPKIYCWFVERIRKDESEHRKWCERLGLALESDYNDLVGNPGSDYVVYCGELQEVVCAEFRI